MKKILFITPYPYGKAGSQRFRFEMFFDILVKEGYLIKQSPFIDDATWKILYNQGNILKKIFGTLKGYLRRLTILFKTPQFDYIFIHREATPIGPPLFEWFCAKVLKKKIIYDFDDAIWKNDVSNENRFISFLKQPSKVSKICEWSYKVSAGNAYLASYAKKFNKNTFIVPTIVNTEGYHNRIQNQNTDKVNIGWTGSGTTLKYLNIIVPVIKELENEYDFNFLVIADKDPKLPLKSFRFIPWNKETEIDDLLKFHIGVMPLFNDEWEKGKCGFKAIQYMSLGIPAIVTAIGVNTEIVQSGINGYLITHDSEWKEKITYLLKNENVRIDIAKEARKTIVDRYSVHSTKQIFIKLFD